MANAFLPDITPEDNEIFEIPEEEIANDEYSENQETGITTEMTEEKQEPPSPALENSDTPHLGHKLLHEVNTPKDTLILHIEKIMEEGIGEAYENLTMVEKQEFKITGEHAASAIKTLLQEQKPKVKKIFEIILDWLKRLPGINRFFLLQEAKIKTDKILALRHHHIL